MNYGLQSREDTAAAKFLPKKMFAYLDGLHIPVSEWTQVTVPIPPVKENSQFTGKSRAYITTVLSIRAILENHPAVA